MNKQIVAIAIAALVIAGGAGAYFLLADIGSTEGSYVPPEIMKDPVTNVLEPKDPVSEYPEPGDPVLITRYVTNPVDNDYRIDYYNNTGLYSIYYIYLGNVQNVPIAWETTQKYNGRTPIELSYTTSKTTDKMISRSNENCITQTVESAVSSSNSKNVKVSAGFSVALVGTGVEAGWNAGWGSSNGASSSVSTTDTYTSFMNWSETNASAYKVTVGDHGEAAGFYRYTLFATADVFVTVVVDNTNSECYYDYSTFARPDSYFMELDYSEDNNFVKDNEYENFRFTNDVLVGLPSIPLSETIMFLDYRGQSVNNNPIIVPYDTLEVIIIDDASRTLSKNIIINARSVDLKITLNNVKLSAPQGKIGIQDLSVGAPNHTITFLLVGDNTVKGGNGGNGVNGSPGTQGGNGAAGIDVTKNHSVVMIGPGKLTVAGGNGGNGGNGNDSKDAHVQYRDGGAGGNGGQGVVCKDVSFEKTSGKITLIGGTGGKGGKGGNSTALPVVDSAAKRTGGAGGNGGNGGWALDTAADPKQTTSVSEPLSLTGGRGGSGGAGGNGQGGGTGGSNGWNGVNASDNYFLLNGSAKRLGS
ncbi:MAG: hypothetical protein LBE48_00405 [Methanomassiliicoccaceae archaeon]|jgi:hypothetical protein|nr:hypothetical protein [Methanomassiliicoccaceae archaeon]